MGDSKELPKTWVIGRISSLIYTPLGLRIDYVVLIITVKILLHRVSLHFSSFPSHGLYGLLDGFESWGNFTRTSPEF